MANEQKTFLAKLSESWSTAFPSIKPAGEDEVHRRPKSCNFLCDAYGAIRNRYYFLQFNFSPKRRGEFTMTITISASRKESILPASEDLTPSPQSIGAFGIWQFMHRPRFDWSLVDLEAESTALLGLSSGLPKSRNVWQPSTYGQPLERVVDEAIAHVNKTLRTHVFPVLQIEA
ncbi:MAG: hypothetical protein ABI651_13565 [Verrucomicrobiota bacterium]